MSLDVSGKLGEAHLAQSEPCFCRSLGSMLPRLELLGYRSLQRFSFPVNMRSMLLPDLDQLRDFSARGPSGVVRTNINGRAAAIECYLDLRLAGRPEAQVTWTNFKESLGIYQGALDFKESYTKAFYEASFEAIATGAYDVSKLRTVLDALFTTCCAMSTDILRRELR